MIRLQLKKRDGRTLDRRTMETIRMDAVARVKVGGDISSVMASYRMARMKEVEIVVQMIMQRA